MAFTAPDIFPHSVLVLFLLATLHTSAYSAIEPDVVQLDIVIPQNGSTYQPVYPFPIDSQFTILLSASHIPSISAGPSIPFPDRAIISEDKLWRDSGQQDSITEPSIPPSPWLLTYVVPEVINATARRFSIGIDFSITDACNEAGIIPTNNDYDVAINDYIAFNISSEGQIPNLQSGEICAEPIGAIKVHGSAPTDGGPRCPLLGDGRYNPQGVESCAYRGDATAQSQVATEMLNASSCNGTGLCWQNATGLVGPRPEKSDGDGISIPVAAMIIVWTLAWGVTMECL